MNLAEPPLGLEPAATGPGAGAASLMYTRFCRKLARACMWLGIAGIVLLICAVTWQVFGRYVLNSTPTWAESLALLLVL